MTTSSLATSDEVVIYYTATLNDNAKVAEYNSVNTNDAFLKYSNQTTVTKEVTVYTYRFDLTKYYSGKDDDGDTRNLTLSGAEFKLYRADQVGNDGRLKNNAAALKFIYASIYSGYNSYKVKQDQTTALSSNTTYQSNDVVDVLKDANGIYYINGLDVGTYYLEETKAPDGYNKLTNLVRIDVSRGTDRVPGANVKVSTGVTENAGNLTYTMPNKASFANATYGSVKVNGNNTWFWERGGVGIENKAGTVLPSTGGIGTTIFYLIGGVLIAGAAALIVIRRRRV